MGILDKYQLKFGNWISLFWSSYISLNTFFRSDFKDALSFLAVTFLLLYLRMMSIWILAFLTLEPIRSENRFYIVKEIIRLLVGISLVVVPFFIIRYYIEIAHVKNLAEFGSEGFVGLYIMRVIFELALVLTFKYLLDSREIAKNYSQETRLLQEANNKAQFEILKQQINPHFLFNSLSTLKSLIRVQDPHAEEFVMSLSDVYRKLLQRRDKDLIRLGDEMEIINAYIFMQKFRFENNLIFEKNIKDADLQLFLPPFSLQLLIENTIKHNIISQKKPLTVRLFVNDFKQIVVENNIQPKKSLEENTGWGLSSLMEHYSHFTKAPIEIKETDNIFSVALPLLAI